MIVLFEYKYNIIIIRQMSNYKQLIQKIFISNDLNKVDHIKKLIYLTVNDSQNFTPFSSKVTKSIGDTLQRTDDDQIKKNLLQLLSEITTNYFQHIPASYYNFSVLIHLLSDDNPQVRKASHYLLLIFIKKYQKIDQVIQNYLKTISQNPDHWKVIQKIIHSFQSLLVIQPKCITYGKKYESMDELLRLLLAFRAHHHHLIQKASDQTVSSFVKNQYTPQVLPKLDGKIISQLITYASKLNIKLSVNKQAIDMLNIDDGEEELQEIKINQDSKKSKKKSIFSQLLKNIESQNDWKVKLQAVEVISNELNVCDQCEIPSDLIEKCLDLTYDYNFKTCITAMNILLTLVSKFPNLIVHKKEQLQDVIIEKVCDLKMAVRQIACKVLKKLYQTTNKYFNKKLLVKLSNCSVVGKEEILNFLQQNYSAIQSNDLTTVLTDVSSQLMNENTRIKIKTIDCLVKLSVSNNLEQCKQILQKKLNKVYYDMFLQRLKQKITVDKSENVWDNDKNFNKGMTWQAQRSAPLQNVDKQSYTKVEFGVRKLQKNNHMIDTIEDFSYEKPIKKVESTVQKKSTLKSISNKTANTFDTFQSQDSNSYKLTKKNLSSKQGSSFLSHDQQFKTQIEEKKAPLKPNPIKKKTVDAISNVKEDSLVIQSKQYLTKNNDEETKPIRESMQVKKNNLQQSSTSTTKTVPKQPFSIKKSSSINKKDHQIDYKATYYTAKQELAVLQNPNAALKQIISSLPKDNDWNKQFQSLNLIRRYIKNHEDIFNIFYDNLPAIMPEVLKLVESLRSSLAKNAMITLSQMCQAFKKAMDPFLEPIFVRLFKKAQDANSFIVQEVSKCITSLCHYCSTNKIASIITMNCQTKAIPVKLKVALCIDKLIQKKQYNVQTLKQNPKLVSMMNSLISDSSVEVRNIIKQTFENICRQNQKGQVEDIFKKNSTKQSWEKFKKILDKQGKTLI